MACTRYRVTDNCYKNSPVVYVLKTTLLLYSYSTATIHTK